MYKGYEAKHMFMAAAIGILFLSPILLLLIPSFVANSIHHTDSWFVIVPGKSYAVYALGFLFLFLAALIPFLLDVRKKSILISVIFFLLSSTSFVIASQAYTSLSDQSISYNYLLSNEPYTYSWDEIDQIVYYEIPREEGFSIYEFHFYDGNRIEITENGIIWGLRGQIRNRLEIANKFVEYVVR
ncbi:hypothetical protein GMD78_06360 [Ornithinibacillus sp. L9]|uniref:Uncharacterized protein n=1 Tax=Ornithinibacillus caprae TaxID=2678566 RepID=A0A6N8FFN7_9BACI|nr:hypothetical protein [Ornithinibacillus caprae]MUK88021.1 hypothetical protein [Ornithinibacillus caprae]